MRTHLLLALVGALLLLPAAGACSFAGEPPRPATFTLVPDDGSAPHELVVGGRMSGAMCELSNPFAFDGSTFAWLETAWNPERQSVMLYDVEARGTVQAVRLPHAGVERFGLWDGRILYRHSEYPTSGGRTSAFHVLDVATGDVETLAFPAGNFVDVLHDGPRIVATLRTGPDAAGRYTDALYVYDASLGRFTVEDRALRGITDNGAVSMSAAGDGWIAFHTTPATLYEIASGETVTMPRGRVVAIHSGYAWATPDWGSGAVRMKLPDGAMESVEIDGRAGGFVPGYTVVGQFAPPGPVEVPPVEPDVPAASSGPGIGMILRIAGLLIGGPLGLLGALFALL